MRVVQNRLQTGARSDQSTRAACTPLLTATIDNYLVLFYGIITITKPVDTAKEADGNQK